MAYTGVTFVPTDDSAGALTTWTFGFTVDANLAATGTVLVTFPSGFDLTGVTQGSVGGPPSVSGSEVLTGFDMTGDGTFIYTVSVSGQTITAAFYSFDADPVLPASTPATFSIAGIENAGAGTYEASGFVLSSSAQGGSGSPSSDIVIAGSALTPTATNTGVSTVTASAVQLNGTVSSRGAETTVVFRYGTDPTLSTGTATVAATQSPLASDASGAAVSAALEGLANERLYYRIEATNSEGQTNSAILPFSPATTRYWVGGTGNWGDAENWSATSGGAGGAGAPTRTTNARFDANSFDGAAQVVTLDAAIECLSMDWTGATGTPELDCGTDGVMVVFGSITLISAMTISGNLAPELGLSFESSPPLSTGTPLDNTLDMAGHTFPLTNVNPIATVGMHFDGGGSWTLESPFIQPNTHVYIDDGTLIASGQNIEARGIAFESADAGLNVSAVLLHVHDFLIIPVGTVVTTGAQLKTEPDLDYTIVSVINGQTFASWYAGKASELAGDGRAFSITNQIAISGRLTLEAGGSYDTEFGDNGQITVGSLRVSGGGVGNLAAVTGPLVASRTLKSNWLDLTDCPLSGVTPGYAGAGSEDNTGNTNWLFEAAPSVEKNRMLMGVG